MSKQKILVGLFSIVSVVFLVGLYLYITSVKITDVRFDLPDTIECYDSYTIVPEFAISRNKQLSDKQLARQIERLGMHYVSDDTSVVDVDDSGNIHAVGVGTANIQYVSEDGGLSAADSITVVISPKSMTDPDTLYLPIGGTKQLTPAVEPSNATNVMIQYTALDTEISTVDKNGNIEGIAAGKTTVLAQIAGTDIHTETQITVQPPIEKISVSSTFFFIKVGHTKQISFTVSPENAYTENLMMRSEDESIAIVDEDGTITAVGQGSTEITVTDGNITASCKLLIQNDMVKDAPVPGNVVIPDLNINTPLGFCSVEEKSYIAQSVTDAPNLAAEWNSGAGVTIADHWNQGNFTNIQYSIPGVTVAYINGTKYVCESCFNGYNVTTTITDNAGNDIMNTLQAGQAMLYTCNGSWQNVHIAIYRIAS